jgi:hypothetical protein
VALKKARRRAKRHHLLPRASANERERLALENLGHPDLEEVGGCDTPEYLSSEEEPFKAEAVKEEVDRRVQLGVDSAKSSLLEKIRALPLKQEVKTEEPVPTGEISKRVTRFERLRNEVRQRFALPKPVLVPTPKWIEHGGASSSSRVENPAVGDSAKPRASNKRSREDTVDRRLSRPARGFTDTDSS